MAKLTVEIPDSALGEEIAAEVKSLRAKLKKRDERVATLEKALKERDKMVASVKLIREDLFSVFEKHFDEEIYDRYREW